MQLPELREFNELFGKSAGDAAARRAFSELLRVAGTEGIPARTEADTFALFMPRHTAEELTELFERTVGRAFSIEFESHGHEVLLLPEVLARRVRSDETIASAYQTLCHDIAQTRNCEQRRQTYLRKERESHTRPSPLSSVKASSGHWPQATAREIPETIRMELR
jgi:GGDEF domain-containing protein